ncbi:hypothetical protein Tco_1517371 [Tanacetum coccineum]
MVGGGPTEVTQLVSTHSQFNKYRDLDFLISGAIEWIMPNLDGHYARGMCDGVTIDLIRIGGYSDVEHLILVPSEFVEGPCIREQTPLILSWERIPRLDSGVRRNSGIWDFEHGMGSEGGGQDLILELDGGTTSTAKQALGALSGLIFKPLKWDPMAELIGALSTPYKLSKIAENKVDDKL